MDLNQPNDTLVVRLLGIREVIVRYRLDPREAYRSMLGPVSVVVYVEGDLDAAAERELRQWVALKTDASLGNIEVLGPEWEAGDAAAASPDVA